MARTFVREKKIYCGYDYLEVDAFNYAKTEQENARNGKRSKKEIISTPKQIDWNEINSKRYFLQLLNTNFTEEDLHLSLSYAKGNEPQSEEEMERDYNNLKRRIEYRRKKEGLPPGKYIYIPNCTFKKDGITPARPHHHIIMSGGLDRDVVEDLWRKRRRKGQKKGDKIGYANADRLQMDENGLGALCEYLSKQAGGKKRWSSSQNLDKPEPETVDPDTPPKAIPSRFSASANIEKPWSRTNDHSFSRKEIEKICKEPPDPAYWEKRYPGYTLCGGGYGFKAIYSDTRGWALYLKLRRIKD